MKDTKIKNTIDVKNIGNVKLFKDECKFFEDYKTMKNSHVYREGTNDEYVVFNTIKLSDIQEVNIERKIKKIYKVSQLSIHGEFLCDFGFFTDKKDAEDKMLKGFEKLYKGFKKDIFRVSESQWQSDKHDFIVNIEEITLNKFGEI